MSTIEINGTSLEYKEAGSGELIVFVHGSNSDYRTWEAQVNEFANQYKVVSYSRRYHYPNASIPEDTDYAMAEQLDDLQAFIHSLDADKVHLVGHSYGAFLGILLAIREPELLQSLVLAEPPIVTLFISIPPKPQEILKLLLTRPRTALAIIRFAVNGLNPATKAAQADDMEAALRIFASAILGTEVFNNLSEERLQQARQNNIKAELLGSGFLPVDDADIRKIQIPTLLINGANSPALFHRLIERLSELLPDSQRVIIPNASHISHEDNSEDYNAAVLAFIKQHHMAQTRESISIP